MTELEFKGKTTLIISSMKIKFSEYQKLTRANRGRQVLFVPQHLQKLFGLPEMVDKSGASFLLLLQGVTLTRGMCKYLHVDESLEGLTGRELFDIKHFQSFTKTLAEYNGSSKQLGNKVIRIKHPVVSETLMKAVEGDADAIDTITRQTGNFDDHPLIKELEVPEFLDTSDDDSSDTDAACEHPTESDYTDTDLDTGDDEERCDNQKCYTVRVSQGEYSSEESQSIATFTDPKRARKFVKRLDKVVFTHHPLDDYRVVGKKLLKIHPQALFRRKQNIEFNKPTYYIETVDLIQS